ncbi:hypothetical protein GH714_000035 [Hevea brasiliensis]|uniref:Uncharacterized protein n=1 Tax=Hevea brasiliensis TaxID=3981 RepID=A0A6A6LAV3_HEVBR|nr:hypothetical protein GH714_000035 [Hevea brasiliensis]
MMEDDASNNEKIDFGFLDWLTEVDHFFEYAKISKERKMLMSLQEARNFVLKVEMMLREKTRQIYYPTYDRDDHQSRAKKEETSQDVSLGGNVEIAKNSISVNNKANSFNPPKPNNPYAKPVPVKCYMCNEKGYRSNECSKRKSVNIFERHDDDDDDGEIYYGEDEEKDCQHDELICSMRMSMFIQKIDDKSFKDFIEQKNHLEFEFDTLTMPFAMVDDEEFEESVMGREGHKAKEISMKIEIFSNKFSSVLLILFV